MIVKVDIPPRELWALSAKAEREGVTVGDLLLAAATSGDAMQEPGTETTRQRVRQLWSQGLCDADIAAEMRITTRRVAVSRQGMKLPANRRFKPTAEAARSAANKQHQAEKRQAS